MEEVCLFKQQIEFHVEICLVVATSAIDCLERLISEMTCYVDWDDKLCSLEISAISAQICYLRSTERSK